MFKALVRSAFSEDGRRKHYYIVYTFAFGLMALFCFSWYIKADRSLIWNADGWQQHFKAVVYYAKYLRGIVRHLIYDHKLIIPEWDFYIGEGSDIVNTLSYYVMGDPLMLLSVFVPTRYMQYFFSFCNILRMYLAGIAFSALCLGTGLKNRYGILAGTLGYSFCGWALLNAVRHVFFINPLIYFPLMILGIENIIRKRSPYLFIIIAAISAASNFYFFYMIALLAVLYTIIRLGFLYKGQVKEGVTILLKMGGMAVLGVCIAAVSVLPAIMCYLGDSRMSSGQSFYWLYSMAYYSKMPSVFVKGMTTDAHWLVLGFTAVSILTAFLLFIRKGGSPFLRTLFVIGIVLMLFPIAGRILNGMSYAANRWSWAFAVLCMYILAGEWESLISLTRKEWLWLLVCTVLYYGILNAFEYSRDEAAVSSVVFPLAALIILRVTGGNNKRRVLQQVLLLMLTAAGSFHVAYWGYAPGKGNYVDGCRENKKVWDEWKSNEANAVRKLADPGFTRMSGRNLTFNANIFNDISSTQYFWTLSNPYFNNFRTDLEMREYSFYKYNGYDERAALQALSAVQYYSVREKSDAEIPYGFSFVESVSMGLDESSDYCHIYKNEYPLPIAYCYDAYIDKDYWESCNPVQKQEIQLDAAYTDEEPEGIKKVTPEMSDYLIPYELECKGDEIVQTEDGFAATGNNTAVVLTLSNAASHAELYVELEGLHFKPTAEYDLYFGDKSVDPNDLYNKADWDLLDDGTRKDIKHEKFYWDPVKNVRVSAYTPSSLKKGIDYRPPEAAFASGRHDYIVNTGFSEEPATTVTIKFPLRGVYKIDNIRVYSIPLDTFPEKVEKLGRNALENIEIGNDTVSGNIRLDDTKLLCLAEPFSKGWSAYIDGSRTKVYCVNERYLGIVIPGGDHQIRFVYNAPYKKAGFVLTVIGLLLFAGLVWINKKKGSRRSM